MHPYVKLEISSSDEVAGGVCDEPEMVRAVWLIVPA